MKHSKKCDLPEQCIEIQFVDEKIECNEPIEEDKPLDEVRQDAYSLPKEFQWDTLDLDNAAVVS